MENQIQRNPDVAATSRVAALDVADQGNFDKPPKISLQWCQPFMTLEFKLLEKDLTPKFNDTAKADFTSITRAYTFEQAMLEESDTSAPITQEIQGKRKSNTDQLEGPSSKIRRSGSGLKISASRSPSNHSRSEFIGASESQEAVSHRVQLASYALEMLSYNLGVLHAINLLIIGKLLSTL